MLRLLLRRNNVAVANVGDSRAYFLTGGRMEQVTTDHTVVHMLMEKGEITEEEMETILSDIC